MDYEYYVYCIVRYTGKIGYCDLLSRGCSDIVEPVYEDPKEAERAFVALRNECIEDKYKFLHSYKDHFIVTHDGESGLEFMLMRFRANRRH